MVDFAPTTPCPRERNLCPRLPLPEGARGQRLSSIGQGAAEAKTALIRMINQISRIIINSWISRKKIYWETWKKCCYPYHLAALPATEERLGYQIARPFWPVSCYLSQRLKWLRYFGVIKSVSVIVLDWSISFCCLFLRFSNLPLMYTDFFLSKVVKWCKWSLISSFSTRNFVEKEATASSPSWYLCDYPILFGDTF